MDERSELWQVCRHDIESLQSRLETLEREGHAWRERVEGRLGSMEAAVRDWAAQQSEIRRTAEPLDQDIRALKAHADERDRWVGAWQAHLHHYITDSKAAWREMGARLTELEPVLARLHDLSKRFDQAFQELKGQEGRRDEWQQDFAKSVREMQGVFEKVGSPLHTFEQLLQGMVKTLEAKRKAQKELAQAPLPESKLQDLQTEISDIQSKLDRQMALVQAWLKGR